MPETTSRSSGLSASKESCTGACSPSMSSPCATRRSMWVFGGLVLFCLPVDHAHTRESRGAVGAGSGTGRVGGNYLKQEGVTLPCPSVDAVVSSIGVECVCSHDEKTYDGGSLRFPCCVLALERTCFLGDCEGPGIRLLWLTPCRKTNRFDGSLLWRLFSM